MAVLFIVFAMAMGVATFIENDYGTETAKAIVYNAWWFEGIMVLFAINFFGNILKFKLFKKEKLASLVFHISFFLIILGAGITRYVSYEGIMPIKEGAVSNKFLTEKNYISITVNDGKEQKTPFHKGILLSSLGGNSFDYYTDFKGTDVSIELTDYIPNAQEVFEENEVAILEGGIDTSTELLKLPFNHISDNYKLNRLSDNYPFNRPAG